LLINCKKNKKTKINATNFYQRILPSLSGDEARELERIENSLRAEMNIFSKKIFSI